MAGRSTQRPVPHRWRTDGGSRRAPDAAAPTRGSDLVAELTRQALEDPLTGLPNRRAFDLAVASAQGGAIAVLDLDGFKRVNDRLGHAVGDRLLQAVAEVAAPLVPSEATFARLGGDEFALVVPAAPDADAIGVAARCAAAVLRALGSIGFAGRLSGSAGVAPVTDPAAALRDAGVALRASKRAGTGRTTSLDAPLRAQAARHAALAAGLDAALADHALGLRFRPLTVLRSGQVVGVEASVWWDHPTLGDVEAGELLAVAAPAGLVERLGERVLQLVADQADAWRRTGGQLPITVAVPPLELCEPGFGDWFGERAVGLAGVLVLEVSAAAVEEAPARANLAALHERGFAVTLAGFSDEAAPLASLVQVTAQTVKLDLSSPSAAGDADRAAAVLDAVAALGHRLGLVVAADGIGDLATEARARDLGCDLGLGPAFGAPVAAGRLHQPAAAVHRS
ncbi:EAL domain-containing protein [Aquihabitans sp. G128]|uniref:GGDEF domain-containing protein n=1 Tax=Aquihabitans sp. G128 TaxID=2849779 RepID=UPI001C22533E|nr:diguanylate cyclase [Aquihabitans sp. G128]QXC60195.1 EAL domain-containing protein [Aquihabitans sp. G128]